MSVNQDGKNLEEFLEEYNKDAYEKASHTVDMIIISKKENKLSILLIKRKNHPCINMWALPGGFVDMDESLEEAAKRELYEETNLEGAPLTQLITLGDLGRDPRDRNISTGYISLIEEEKIVAGDDASDAKWFDIVLKEEEFEGNTRVYNLIMEKEEILEAKIKVYFKETPLSKYRIEIIENEKLAFDHPKFIGYGLLYLREMGIIRFPKLMEDKDDK